MITILLNSATLLLINNQHSLMGIDVIKLNKKEQKKQALQLRRDGFSYSEIQKKIPVAKATLSLWLKNIKLSTRQINRLKQKRSEAAAKGAQKKKHQAVLIAKTIKTSSIKDIKKISKREFWLIGIVLYWKERLYQNDFKKGVHFTSSDPDIVRLFLKWLHDIGGLKKEEIYLDIFISKNKKKKIREVKNYWSKITGFNLKSFSRVYLQKTRLKKTRKKTTKVKAGFLRIRVKASSMLARQIFGWIEGVKKGLGL